ncbi:MAG TPA: serine/threonine-protein kinase, partial [Acidimicrobiales bacterium]|nr:serine/threonine-protein kinase [Acidimicrobiales bacterium]
MANVAPSTPHVGTILEDRYELVRHVARGGMGDVYEAVDAVLQRSVAVKVFRSAGPADRARFDAEVHVLAGLGHRGLVRVFDAGSHGDDAYVVLELIDGPPLSKTLAERGPIPAGEVTRLGAEVADALAYIHERGVVHRDVTPSNILCDPDGRPRLVDFGIARLLDGPRVTTTSLTVGTPSYMAPEQLEGSAVTPAADVYALGLVLLEALTGRRAFEGTLQETAMARLASGPDVPGDLPGPWRSLLISMTSRSPAARPAAAEVRDRLVALAGGAGSPE